MRIDVGGEKRRKCLVLIAAFLDAGRTDPTIRELAERTKLPRNAVVQLIAALPEDGHLAVAPKDGGAGNRYVLPEPPKVVTCECRSRSQLVEADGQDRHCLICGRRRAS
jgi:DNA-binding IscR family transcriptional regulator